MFIIMDTLMDGFKGVHIPTTDIPVCTEVTYEGRSLAPIYIFFFHLKSEVLILFCNYHWYEICNGNNW